MEFIILVCALGAFFISFIFPRAILFSAIAALPFYKVIGALSISVAQITAFEGLIMALFTASILKLPFFLRQNKLLFFDLIVILWNILNAASLLFYRESLIYSLNTFRNFVVIPTMLYFVVRFYITDLKTLKRFLLAFVIATSIMALLGIKEFFHTHQRIETVLGAGHAGSILMAIGMFSSILLLRETKHIFAVIMLVASVFLNFTGVILVFGRIMIASIILMPLIIAFLLKRRLFLILIFTFCFLFAGFVSPLQVKLYDEGVKAYIQMRDKRVDPKNADRLSDIDQTKAALGVRTIPYLISLEYIGKRPIFGYGYSIHKHLMEKANFPLAHSHNVGLDIMLRTGFLGLFAFAAVILFIVKYARTKTKEVQNILQKKGIFFFLGLIFIILSNSFANSLPNLASSCSLWICMGLVISIGNIKLENTPPNVVGK